MEPFNYEFTAIKGVQAGRAYYVAMCPLKLVPKLFVFNEEELPAELRAQRTLNRARVPAIARYITENPTEYVLSSVCASVDGQIEFEPVSNDGGHRSIGRIRIPMTARILINDGQHRRAAIEDALKERQELGDETISVVLFVDAGLKRAQQMFADLNLHAVRPTRSLGVLYDHRDPLAQLARRIVEEVSYFRGLTELEKTTISNRSVKLFTLSSLFMATRELLGKGKGAEISDKEAKLAISFWCEVGRHMPDWERAARREVIPAELRREFVHAHGIALHALAIAGAQLIALHPSDWQKRLKGLGKVDWSRRNVDLWEGRALIGGRLSKARNNILLMADVILRALRLPLTAEGERVERMRTIPTKGAATAHA